MMVSPTAYKAAGADFGRQPVGAGPMKFVSWQTGAKVSMARYDGYWDKSAVHLDALDFSIIPEADTALNAVRSGQQDMTLAVQPAGGRLACLKKDSTLLKVNALARPCPLHDIFYLDTSVPPYDNPDVRRAAEPLAVDREALLQGELLLGLRGVPPRPPAGVRTGPTTPTWMTATSATSVRPGRCWRRPATRTASR